MPLLTVAVLVHQLCKLGPRDARALLTLAAVPGDGSTAEDDGTDLLAFSVNLEPDGGVGLGQFGDLHGATDAMFSTRDRLRHRRLLRAAQAGVAPGIVSEAVY